MTSHVRNYISQNTVSKLHTYIPLVRLHSLHSEIYHRNTGNSHFDIQLQKLSSKFHKSFDKYRVIYHVAATHTR
jgi:hypothetical protein